MGARPRLCEVDVGQWPTYVLSWAPLLEGKINHCPLCREEGAKKVALGWPWKRCLPGSISIALRSTAPRSSWLRGGPNEGVDGFLQQQPWPLDAWAAQAPWTCRGGGWRPPILACFAPFCASMGDRSLVCPGDSLSEQVSTQKEGVPTPWTPCPGRPPTLPSGGHGCSISIACLLSGPGGAGAAILGYLQWLLQPRVPWRGLGVTGPGGVGLVR